MKVKLTKFRTAPPQYAMVETNATIGATVGVDLLGPDGKVIQWGQIANAEAGAASPLNTTDDLQEGQWNLWFTSERAQDAVGSILANSANVTLTYVDNGDGAGSITANLTTLTDAGGGALLRLVRDAWGRITGTSAATLDDISDVDAPTPADKQVLTFNVITGKWEAKTPSGGGGSSSPMPVNVQTGTSYTLIAGDAGGDVQCGNASPVTVTIPKDTFTVGDWLLSSQIGAGTVTYVGAAGVTFETAGTKATISKGDVIGLEMVAANVWRFIGGMPGIGDAPSDSTIYGRKNGAWVAAGGAAQALVVLNKQSASFAITLADFPTDGTIIDVQVTSTNAENVTIPTNATVAAPIGSQVVFSAWGTGMVTALAASGVTLINPFGAATTAQYDSRYARKVDTDTWQIL